MSDCTSLPVTTDQRIKAENVLEEARGKFSDIKIDITESEISFSGEVYENTLKCKYFFEIKLGLRQRRERPERTIDPDPYSELPICSKYMTYEKIDIEVVNANLMDYDGKVDCFVNTTNNKLEMRSQVSKLFTEAGGQAYEEELDKVKQKASTLETTECISTAAGNMGTEHIIHVLCPIQKDYTYHTSDKEVKNDVFSTVFNCLKMAEELEVHSIAIPFLSTGNGKLDIGICSEQYASAVLEFSRLRESRFVVEKIYFVDTDDNKVDSVNKVFKQIIPMSGLELLEIPRKDNEVIYEESICGAEPLYETVDNDTDLGDAVGGKRKSDDYNSKQTGLEKGLEIHETIENNDYEDVDKPEEIETKTDEEIQKYRMNVGRYNLIVEKTDIRNSKMIAIVCPENEGVARGGLLAASIKCTFRKAFKERKLSKIQKKAIATTEYIADDGTVQYILHVLVPVWKDGVNETQLEKELKNATVMIFDKLTRHKKRKIPRIAIPLIGIGNVENDDVVSKCCKWQVEQIVEILQKRKEIPNLQEVRLINRCEKIRNTLITHLQVLLSH